MKQQEMWNNYLQINPMATKYEAWAFGGNSSDTVDQLAHLVLKGIKTATSSAYDSYGTSPLPQEGAYNIILDASDQAVCITKTTKVYTSPFYKVTAEHAYKEGEFDRTLLSWRENHKKFFAAELREINQEFSEDILVVCEEFEVVYPEN